jgi:hypothetical protein
MALRTPVLSIRAPGKAVNHARSRIVRGLVEVGMALRRAQYHEDVAGLAAGRDLRSHRLVA